MGYVRERFKSYLMKYYDRYGDLIQHYYVSLSQMLHDILGHDHIQWHPQLTPICDLITELNLITDFDLITKFWDVSRTLQRRVRLANIWHLLLQKPDTDPIGTCICSNAETIFLSCFRVLSFDCLCLTSTKACRWHQVIQVKPTNVYITLLKRGPECYSLLKNSEHRQIIRSLICLTFIGFTRIPINTDSLRVHRSVRPSLYPFVSRNCLHILV